EGAYRNLSRRRIRRELPAEAENRTRRQKRDGRCRDRGDHHQGEDRPDRRREDLRHTARAGRAYPDRRAGRRRAVTHETEITILEGESSMRFSKITRLGLGIGAAISALALTTGSALAAAQAPDPLNSGDTAWMITSSALVLLMTIPGLALFY